jgi:pyruvate formate lyase activating enzyme
MGIPQLSGGFVFDIQGFSVHDGPGCRTLIFLKGCSLHCAWCSNPEGIDLHPNLMFDYEKCNVDGICIKTCPNGALYALQNELRINREACLACKDFLCTKECLTNALRLAGSFTTVTELFKIIQRDRQFWGSEGGITLTGGEPLLQIDFAKEILKKCYEAYIHTAVETCGNVPWKNFADAIPWIDFIYFDLKIINAAIHRDLTGASNELILDNARRLAQAFQGKLIFRMPVLPGINDSTEQLTEVINFMNSINKNEIQILPLHHLGREKYRLLGKKYTMTAHRTPSRNEMIRIQQIFRSGGVKCYLH